MRPRHRKTAARIKHKKEHHGNPFSFQVQQIQRRQDALNILRRLQQQNLIRIIDAAVVEWPQDRKTPRTRQAVDTTGEGTLGGAFWGFLFGPIFFVPLLGMALGAATGALTGALTDVGIDDDFIKQAQPAEAPARAQPIAI